MIKAAYFISRYFLKDKKEFELEKLKFLSESDQIYLFFSIFKAKSWHQTLFTAVKTLYIQNLMKIRS